jgi:hypothetical protein
MRIAAAQIEFILTPRGQMGWPCFHCGQKLSACGTKKRCCAKCKGSSSH